MMKVTKCLMISLLMAFVNAASLAHTIEIQRIHPSNWWVGMKNPNVQLLVYGKNISKAGVSVSYPGVRILKTHKVENPNYLFVDLGISKTAKAGTLSLVFTNGDTKTTQKYVLGTKRHIPVTVNSSDFVYLLMPDRFANGDESNDQFADMLDTKADKSVPYFRHGGDFQGIINHLDYLQELGVTTLWNTPVIENNTGLKKELHGNLQAAYHGYHFSDHYKIDRRLGGNAGYKQLSAALHQRGMKLIQDAVYNHVSEDHWMFVDPPAKDWFNRWPSYTGSTHKEQAIADPNGSESDRKYLTDGWFTPFLPDVNQRNPFFATYLIQHALWCTEEFGLDGWRIDTYKYNDMPFMNRCNQALMDEYPNLLIFGETWVTNPASLSYFVRNNVKFPLQCNQPGTCDFPSFQAINDGLRESFGWDTGINRVYQALSQDFLYHDPTKMVTFLENHDTDRFFSVIGEDFNKYKLGVAWLLTTRGIPHFYYGTEVLMKNVKNPTDAEVRKDFMGGWKSDKENKFTAAGRTARENEAFEFVKKLANYRKNTPALHSGKLMQFVPQNGFYVYFRYNAQKTIMVVMNTNAEAATLETARFAERMAGFTAAKNVLTDESLPSLTTLRIPAMTAWVLELK
ncbi:glycoside hydrolase family 13 protein [Runella slithyformis]|uniref:Cyclomaltodextrinase n=1 Tax=Runella slithyformis (strain ATCC 29530 / DSM 19594 / LMG 11500 / NCIMB 11436 / LSU 4) TaxID=761193 RepID=A0A7U3ZQF4_RUNSL|nr:glycoside hydrolase family 13 protein [Runella slithyformis]AEI51465.1 Cyclomaltodextrinase [Runella slithyformis DSM 19594]